MSNLLQYRLRKNSYLIYRKGQHFIGAQWSGGIVLLAFVGVALLLANLPATAHAYHDLLTTGIGISAGGFTFDIDVEKFVNDGLMMIFFFVVGLEIKREIVAGELSHLRQAVLPAAAAFGGMVFPALIFVLLNADTPYAHGWGVPMATDIAFAIGIMSLLGRRVPVSLKVFLTALAIVDDLGSILVIAIFYGGQIQWGMLGAAALILVGVYVLNRMRVTAVVWYAAASVALWWLFYHSGIHATIAGVLLAMLVPTKPRYSKKYFIYKVRYFVEDFRHRDRAGQEVLANEEQFETLDRVRRIAAGTSSLTQRLEHGLTPLVTWFIMPVFALANAGVSFASASGSQVFTESLGQGIFLGLVIGKPLGIVLMCWLFIRLGLADLPPGASWGTLFAVSCLGGIGFTMSIFIDTLAFAGDAAAVDTGKIAVLLASAVSALAGAAAIGVFGTKRAGKVHARME